MKYCYKCGNPMEDDMSFCQKCGTRAMEPSPEYAEPPYAKRYAPSEPRMRRAPEARPKERTHARPLPTKFRTGLLVSAWVCVVFAAIYVLIALSDPTIVSAAGFFGVLAFMFFVLARSPKGSPFLLGMQAGLKKPVFVLLCVVLAFVIAVVSASILIDAASPGNSQTEATPPAADAQQTGTAVPTAAAAPTAAAGQTPAVTLSDIQAWYEGQMPAVGQTLPEYAQSVSGLSHLNVNSSRFFFGGDWSDCYYKFTFSCKINGVNHTGEARAFLKYREETATWFSFEIFANDGFQSVVELYDDSYDAIIEDYYHELETLHGA